MRYRCEDCGRFIDWIDFIVFFGHCPKCLTVNHKKERQSYDTAYSEPIQTKLEFKYCERRRAEE